MIQNVLSVCNRDVYSVEQPCCNRTPAITVHYVFNIMLRQVIISDDLFLIFLIFHNIEILLLTFSHIGSAIFI